MSFYRRIVVTPLCLLVVAGAVVGCKPPPEPHPEQIIQSPPDTISVYQLAGRLGLYVAESDRRTATLRGPRDTVTIYADPGGSVFVNARRLAHAGPLPVGNGTIFVPESMVGPIRASFRPAPPPPPPPEPEPVRPAPTHRVVIDPGHGGRDPGTTACRDAPEKTVVLAVARKLRDHLIARRVDVIMTRDDDEFVELEERARIANRTACDLFVSIHADSAENVRAWGHTVYVARANVPASLAAARCIDRRLAAVTGCSRGVRRADYRVLVKNERPAVLVEIGFMSNRAEAARLCSRDHQDRLAEAIAEGVLDAVGR